MEWLLYFIAVFAQPGILGVSILTPGVPLLMGLLWFSGLFGNTEDPAVE